ncbi:MAG: sorbosone dehydrogenase family protein [Candidatus Velthaea sp.]
MLNSIRRVLSFFAAALVLIAPAGAQFDQRSGLSVPAGFTIERIAGVPNARELAIAPNGDVFVGTSGNSIYVVPDAEQTAGAAGKFVTLDDQPVAGVAIDGDAMYLGAQFGVYKLPYRSGDRTARAKPQKIAAVRTSGASRDHVTTTVAVAKDRLYASVGSTCNVCDPDADPTRATIQQMHLDGSGMEPKAEHIRNAIALTVNQQTGSLWAGVAGQDELAHGHPYEIFDDVSAHGARSDYGWPHCYENRRAVDAQHNCSNAAVPRVILPAYETPIGAVFYPERARGKYAFPAEYAGGGFVTLHGSWHTPPVPPRVVFIAMNGDMPKTAVDWDNPTAQWREFVGGFQHADGSRPFRPTGVAVGTDGSLFVSDDRAGAIFRIRPRR